MLQIYKFHLMDYDRKVNDLQKVCSMTARAKRLAGRGVYKKSYSLFCGGMALYLQFKLGLVILE